MIWPDPSSDMGEEFYDFLSPREQNVAMMQIEKVPSKHNRSSILVATKIKLSLRP